MSGPDFRADYAHVVSRVLLRKRIRVRYVLRHDEHRSRTAGQPMRTGVLTESPAYTPAEVAHLFRVDPKTVTRWAQQGKVPSFRTLGGHRRYPRHEVDHLLWLAAR